MATTRSWLPCLSIDIPSSDESIAVDDYHCCSSRGAKHSYASNQQQVVLSATPLEVNSSHHFVADIRMPEISVVRPTSPGGTCRDTNDVDHDDHATNFSDEIEPTTKMTVQRKVYTQRIPPKVPPPPFPQYGKISTPATTVMDAYNRGMLFSHFTSMPSAFSCCWTDTTSSAAKDSDEFEKNWSGHQPLMPKTWSPSHLSYIADKLERCSKGRIVSASEIRYRRRRRRRGILWTPHNNDLVMQKHQDDYLSASRDLFNNGKAFPTSRDSNT